MLTLLLVLATAPDGTATDKAVQSSAICWWFELGEFKRPLSPDWAYPQGYGWWGIYAKGEVTLDVRTRTGWWAGDWTTDVWAQSEPRVVSLTGLRDEKWRRHGMALESWLGGSVLACVHAGSAYVWGTQLKAWGTPNTAQPFAQVCASPFAGVCR